MMHSTSEKHGYTFSTSKLKVLTSVRTSGLGWNLFSGSLKRRYSWVLDEAADMQSLNRGMKSLGLAAGGLLSVEKMLGRGDVS